MNVKEYMGREFELLQKRVEDVSKAHESMDPNKTMAESMEIFDDFKRFFAMEDFIFSKLRPTAAAQPVVENFLDKRNEVREILEDMLMLHVSEPDNRNGIQRILKYSNKHLDFVYKEVHPKVMDALAREDWTYLNQSLDDRLPEVTF